MPLVDLSWLALVVPAAVHRLCCSVPRPLQWPTIYFISPDDSMFSLCPALSAAPDSPPPLQPPPWASAADFPGCLPLLVLIYSEVVRLGPESRAGSVSSASHVLHISFISRCPCRPPPPPLARRSGWCVKYGITVIHVSVSPDQTVCPGR